MQRMSPCHRRQQQEQYRRRQQRHQTKPLTHPRPSANLPRHALKHGEPVRQRILRDARVSTRTCRRTRASTTAQTMSMGVASPWVWPRCTTPLAPGRFVGALHARRGQGLDALGRAGRVHVLDRGIVPRRLVLGSRVCGEECGRGFLALPTLPAPVSSLGTAFRF